ncbi:MAG: hypothetical protein ACRDZ8_15105 [Acidimicrobiales bacterium]
MFEYLCLDCQTPITFESTPGEATCAQCGLRLYVTSTGAVGRYLPEGWRPGGIQGRGRGEPE